MAHTLKKTWNIVSGILVALVVALALLLVGARVVGLQVYTVLSGSMEPTYHTGSLIYVKSIDTADIQAGTVITFMLDEDTIATHRVMAVVPDEEDPTVVRFRTKGDANDAEDGSLVHYKNVIGTPVFTIPGLGYLADYIQNPPGTYVAISAGALLLIAVFLPDIFASDKEEEKKEKPKKEKKGKRGKNACHPERSDSDERVILSDERVILSEVEGSPDVLGAPSVNAVGADIIRPQTSVEVPRADDIRPYTPPATHPVGGGDKRVILSEVEGSPAITGAPSTNAVVTHAVADEPPRTPVKQSVSSGDSSTALRSAQNDTSAGEPTPPATRPVGGGVPDAPQPSPYGVILSDKRVILSEVEGSPDVLGAPSTNAVVTRTVADEPPRTPVKQSVSSGDSSTALRSAQNDTSAGEPTPPATGPVGGGVPDAPQPSPYGVILSDKRVILSEVEGSPDVLGAPSTNAVVTRTVADEPPRTPVKQSVSSGDSSTALRSAQNDTDCALSDPQNDTECTLSDPQNDTSAPPAPPTTDLASRLMAASDGLLRPSEVDILVQRLALRPLDEAEIAAIQSLLARRRAQRGQN